MKNFIITAVILLVLYAVYSLYDGTTPKIRSDSATIKHIETCPRCSTDPSDLGGTFPSVLRCRELQVLLSELRAQGRLPQ
jgi:hypothetical protein